MQNHAFDATLLVQEHWNDFTDTDHKTWQQLYQRQETILKDRAVNEIHQGLKKLQCHGPKIPTFNEFNARFKENTGFSIVPVNGLIPADSFFALLAERQFPSTCFIRKPEQMDYLQEPDIFHDVFGHMPLLTHPLFADFMVLFGQRGLEATRLGFLEYAQAFYWFTVEFGLIQTQKGLRIYGAGIASSPGESVYALESEKVERIPFNLEKIMTTPYDTQHLQTCYFVIQRFEDLFDCMQTIDWHTLHNNIINQG